MELLTPIDLLLNAQWDYAVPAVNCFNMEMIQAVLEAAEELKSPIIVQAAPRDIAYSSADTICGIVKSLVKNKKGSIALHLDHGHNIDIVAECIQAGFTGVMFDGSDLPFQENIKLSSKVSELAHLACVSCEAELGTIGEKSEYGEKIVNAYMTDPDKAKEFVDATNVDSLAVGIGNAHGFYPFPPNLDLDLLLRIKDLVSIPLVLHGGTGLPEDQIKQAIKLGIAKVNFSTVARSNMVTKMQDIFQESKELPRVDILWGAGRTGFKDAVRGVIKLCGSNDKL